MRVYDRASIKNAEMLTIKAVAERVMEEVGATCSRYSLIDTPGQYIKKMNLAGDPAAWDAWAIHLRTGTAKDQRAGDVAVDSLAAQRDIAVIAARRRYIPPTMDTSQDIVLVYYGTRMEFAGRDKHGNFLRSKKFMEVPEYILDTIR